MSSIAESRDSLCSEGCEAILWLLIEDVSHVGDSGQCGQCDIVISEFVKSSHRINYLFMCKMCCTDEKCFI